MKPSFIAVVLGLGVAACGNADTNRGTTPNMTSGSPGAGAGPSTVVAAKPSPSPTANVANDSTQNNNGPNAGGPH